MPWPLDRRALTLLVIGLFALAASGCGGDDGKDGKSAVVGVRTSAPDRLMPQITDVSLSSPLVVDFQVTDGNGLGVPGITGGVSFTVNKLMPGTDGSNSHWQSYILADDEGVANAQPGTYGDGTLEGHGDGTYTFTFADELEDISGVSFAASRTHRIGIELRDVTVFGEEFSGSGNGVFDFRPNGGGTQERAIVKNESCQTCHGGPPPFNFHGGPRNDVDYCVTCHQPGATDVGTGNTIEFSILIHKIHGGASDAQWCGFGCEVLGFGPDDFSDVVHPQDVRNCTTCHDPNDPDTPQADLVNNSPTVEVCMSCHSDANVVGSGNVVGFDEDGLTGPGHAAGAQPESSCATCHSEGGLVASVLESHEIPAQVAASRFEYNILSIDNGTAGNQPSVTFSVTDPTNGDARYNLQNHPAFTNAETSVNMDLAWPTSDYTNTDGAGGVTGGLVSRPVSLLLVGDLDGFGPGTAIGLGTGVTANGDRTYTIATGVTVPAGAGLDSGAAVIEGHVSGDFDGDGTYDDSVPVTSAVDYFDIDGTGVQARRDVVDPAKCQNCHGQNDGLAFHGDNRTDNTQVCVVCHNPNQTDINRRPASPVDGLAEQAVDFKYMIHAIHGSDVRQFGYVAYGFGNSPHDYSDTRIPRSVSDCLACHVDEDSYALSLESSVLGATVTTSGNQDPSDDQNVSPEAGTCVSCHDSASAVAHMDTGSTDPTAFGNGFAGAGGTSGGSTDTQAGIDTALPGGENCAFCHGPGGIVDVAEVHAAAGGE